MFIKNNFYSVCLFPNGALTSKSYAFGFRPWELKNYETFDPTAEFYQPIWLSVYNNKIQKILPVNNNNNFMIYHWISNKLRFFFESFNFQDDQFFPKYQVFSKNSNSLLIPVNWSYLFRVMAYKLANLKNFSYVSLNFSHMQKFDTNTYFELNRIFSEIPNFVKILSYNNSVQSLIKSQLINSHFFPPLDAIAGVPSNILLVSFNPYFLDPSLSYYLKSISEFNSVKIYTTFFSYFSINFKVKNLIPNLKNLWLLFSGRHFLSNQILTKNTKIIIDFNILNVLPNTLVSLILKSTFFNKAYTNKHPTQIYIINKNKSYSNFFRIGLNSFIPYKNFLVNFNRRILNFDINSNCGVFLPNALTTKEVMSDLEIKDYNYIFKFEVAKFSYFSEIFNGFYPNYFFPTSGFTEFTTNYEMFANKPNYFKNVVSVYREGGRPLAQIISSIRFWFHKSMTFIKINTLDQSFWIIIIFIFSLINFVNLAILNLYFTQFGQLNKLPCSFITNIKMFNFSVIFNNWLGLQISNTTNFWFVNDKLVFNINGLCKKICNPYVKFQIAYFYPDYVDSCIDSIKNSQLTYSKTLTLNRKFFNSRFKNFIKFLL